MPIIRLLNDEPFGQQAGDVSARSTRQLLYCFDPKDPTKLYEWGGHFITDAPEYQTQEPVPENVRTTKDGLNITEFLHTDDEYIQGANLTIMLPERRVTLARKLLQVQKRRRKLRFRFVTIPADECVNDCQRYAEFVGIARLGEIQKTGATVAFDYEGDGGAINKQIMLYTTGAEIDYDGIKIDAQVQDLANPIYALKVGSRAACADDFCPYQVGYVFSADGVADPVGEKTTDKWGSLGTTLNVAALPSASLIVDSVEWRGDLYIAYASAFKATSTVGGVAKSIGGTAAFASVGLTSAGVQTLVVAGGKLHAFGEAGEWHWTSDGENWTTETALSANDIFCSAYNPVTKKIYVGGAAGYAAAIRGSQIEVLTGFGTDVLTAAFVAGDDHVVFGTSNGKVYEHYSQDEDGGAFTLVKTLGASAIRFIGGDRRQANLVVTMGAEVWQRCIDYYQDWRKLGTSPSASAINAGGQGYEEHREGTDYFAFGCADGTIFEVQSCTPCVA